MKKLLILGIAATVLNALVVWVLTHFLIVVLGAAKPLVPQNFNASCYTETTETKPSRSGSSAEASDSPRIKHFDALLSKHPQQST